MSDAEVASFCCKFDIFKHRPIQTVVLGTVETVHKPLANVERNDLEFLIPGDSDTYIDIDVKLYVRGKLVSSSGNDVELTDTTAVPIIFYTPCLVSVVTLNRFPVTESH
jgi:hypothetical protein